MGIPFELRQYIESGSAVLFVGAGMGYNMVDDDGKPIPDGMGLAKRISDHFRVPDGDTNNLAKVSEYVDVTKGRIELLTFIRGLLSRANPDEFMSWIPTIKWKAIFTTNYDDTIQKAYNNASHPVQDYITITHATGLKYFVSTTQVPIIHLHGALFDETSPDIIISQRDYLKYKEKRKSLFELLKRNMLSSCILYTGYSNNDSTWLQIIDDLEEELRPNKITSAYRIDPNASQMDTILLEERSIHTLKQTFSEFVTSARIEIETKVTSGIDVISSSIPTEYQQILKESPTPTLRFLSSWEYVNSITGAGQAYSVRNFVRGDKPNWSIIINNKFFRRDIEDSIYLKIIDYLTEPKNRTRVCVISGSAGYGISTLMMTLAIRLVHDRAGKVFYHRSPREIREGDIFFASTIDKDKHIFFIDNAADYSKQIKLLIQHAREERLDVIFILGDRLNELNQSSLRSLGDSFILQALSDGEIESLLDFLAQNNELNKLEHLEHEHRISAIKRNYERQLLVAIREATEGKDFDTIIIDEYYGIQDKENEDLSRRAYELACCFHQHGSMIRVELLARLLGVSLSDYYSLTKKSLEGILYYECINDIDMEYAARTRHRFISSIVWNRCVIGDAKDSIIHAAINNLSIALPIDYAAFVNFYKSDNIVDSLVSLDSKIAFFERACQMDPDNPYILQHYARMHVRAKGEQNALAIINRAIELDGTIRILFNTKGYVLSNMMLNTESVDLARRRMMQAEEEYKHALKMNEKDDYSYQGLAQLYLAWASRIVDEQEQTDYLAKAQEIVQDGLAKAKEKEAIWIESANIDRFLGNTSDRIKSLRKAVESAPGSIISRYLLAKAYIANNQDSDGLEILRTLTQEYPDQYAPSIEYAKAIMRTGGSLDNAIAILQQSTLFGYSDSRFIATYGGLLFLNKQFTEASKVFSEATKRQFSNLRALLFKPDEFGLQTEFDAIVRFVGAGYSWLDISDYPNVVCQSSKYNGHVLRRGMQVKVRLSFSPIRPEAEIIVR